MCSRLVFLTHLWSKNGEYYNSKKNWNWNSKKFILVNSNVKMERERTLRVLPQTRHDSKMCLYASGLYCMLLVVCHFDTGRLLWGWELTAMVSDKEENRCPASALMPTLFHAQFKERVTECELEAFCSDSCYIHKVATFFTTLTTKF